jgi:hypothetical protein
MSAGAEHAVAFGLDQNDQTHGPYQVAIMALC